MSNKFTPPPVQTPITDAEGKLSPAWQQWFQLVASKLST